MNIAYFPLIYQDELFYSVLSRFYKHTGLLSNRDALKLVYGNVNSKIDGFFLGKISPELKEAALKQKPLEEIIMENTLFSYYARFLDFGESFSKVLNGEALSLPRNKDRYLKKCPLCCKEDRENYGEAYYHRSHQILSCCTKHRCRLISTNIKISKDNRISFIPLEEDKFDEVLFPTEREYMFDIYREEFLNYPVYRGSFLNTKLIKEKIGNRSLKQVFGELRDFYNDSNIYSLKEHFYISKILNGIKTDPDSILELTFYLDIKIEELFASEKEESEKRELVIKKQRDYTNWEEEDKKYLPLVKEKIQEFKTSNPPKRITVRAISQEFNFPSKRMDKLSSCKKEVINNEESYDDFRIRKIIWAINKCHKEGIPLNWNKVYILTSIMTRYKKQLLEKILNKEYTVNNYYEEVLIRILQ